MRSRFHIAAALAALAGAAPAVHADDVTIADEAHHVTSGTVTLDASPAEVYRAVTDYAHWRALLGDVLSVRVERGGPRDAKVWFRSRILGHEFALQFDNVADREIRFRAVEGPPGAHATGDYVLEPIDGGKRTRVTAHLYIDVSGVASIVYRDAKVRRMRRDKLEADLADTARHFEHPVARR
ncbi:MAG TPA: SRPBCC family protein [Kofleriaceae bacterium]|jgi:uncharacterized protein YndB with AHSA1/START domain